ncbi:hypothetical protein D3C80_1969260 [compost metagenome]
MSQLLVALGVDCRELLLEVLAGLLLGGERGGVGVGEALQFYGMISAEISQLRAEAPALYGHPKQ